MFWIDKSHTKLYKRLIVAILSVACIVGLTACGSNDANEGDPSCLHARTKYKIAREATCREAGIKEIRCFDCNALVSEKEIPKIKHDAEIVQTDSYDATCAEGGKTVSLCRVCGERIETILEPLGHTFAGNLGLKYLKQYDKANKYAEFYKSCKACGEISSEQFQVAIEEAEKYIPTSPTVTMYDTQNILSYGFTWTLNAAPIDAGVLIAPKDSEDWVFYSAEIQAESDWLYGCKAVIALEPDMEYSYKLVDRILEIESETVSFRSVNPQAESFSFASFSDSQNEEEDGSLWGGVLAQVSDVDFYIHSGDICQHPEEESNWQNMIDDNRQYLMPKPLMAISGNHETVYSTSNNVIFKHFHNQIPQQTSTGKGYFYSFIYGNVKFIMLNTNSLVSNQLEYEQYHWLIKELESNTATWTIVVMHNPMYSIGKYGSNSEYNEICLALRTQLNDVFAQYGVDLVLQGHDHAYSKTYPITEDRKAVPATQKTVGGIVYDVNPEGVIYIMTGPAGDQIRGASGDVITGYYEMQASSYKQSWAEYTVTENTLTVTIKFLVGDAASTYNRFGIMKE